MSLIDQVNLLATRAASEIKSVRNAIPKLSPYGIITTPGGVISTSTGTLGPANRIVYSRLTGGIGSISGFYLTIGTSSGNICLAVYSGTGSGISARPNNRKATTGSMVCPAAGEVSIPLSTTISDGDWLGIVADNATVTFERAGGSTDKPRMNGLSHRQDGLFPLPSTATPGNAYGTSVNLTAYL